MSYMGRYDIEKVKTFMQEQDPKIKEVKEFEVIGETNLPSGKSYYSCECPFCKSHIDIQKWSFSTTGKKCWRCGAVLRAALAVLK
ncbi:MAG: hypothetical protein WC365_08665 [Candidatus Babeliales bacterium]|jgi:hypothetical protein